jgi:hypothetical protein
MWCTGQRPGDDVAEVRSVAVGIDVPGRIEQIIAMAVHAGGHGRDGR